MSRPNPHTASDILEYDEKLASQGQLPKGGTANEEAYRLHFREWDAKRADAHALLRRSHPILQLRALLFRGRLSEAQEILNSTPKNGEALLEQTRLAALNGNWNHCIELSHLAWSSDLTPLSRFTLLQVQALAFFEMGEFDRCLQAQQKAESLASLFPNCTAAFYQAILKIRVDARRLGVQAARVQLEHLWEDSEKNGNLDRNLVQALLRAEIDLKRLQGEPHFKEAFASYLLAKSMGEELYEALAVLDCYYALNASERARFELQLRSATKTFERVRRIHEDVRSESGEISSSAHAILNYLASPNSSQANPGNVSSMNGDWQGIFVHTRQITIDLKTGKCASLRKHQKLSKFLSSVCAHEFRELKDIFREIWGKQKYAPDLHKKLIVNLQYRIKSETGLILSMQDPRITAKGIFEVSA